MISGGADRAGGADRVGGFGGRIVVDEQIPNLSA